MTFNERIEKNPMVYLVSTAVTVSAVVYGVLYFLCSQRVDLLNQAHALEVKALEGQMASIRRSLGNDQSLDIRSFVHSKSRRSELRLPSTSRYFEDDGFYASADQLHWRYQKTTEAGLYQILEEETPPPLMAKVGKEFSSVHLWRAKEEFPVEGHPEYYKLFSYVFIEKIPIPEFSKLLGLGVSLAEQRGPARLDAKDFDNLVQQLDTIFRGDVAGALVAMHLQAGFLGALETRQSTRELVELQKIGNVVYVQWLTTLKSLTVAGQRRSEYFIRDEFVFISGSKYIYTIVASVPTAEPTPRASAYRWVNQWFSDLAILVD